MSFRIKDGFTVGTIDIVNSSGQILPYQKDTTTIGQNLSKIPDVAQISFIRLNADETVSALDAGTFRTAIGATTAGSNLFTVTNPGAITFLRINADNTVSTLNAADFRTAIGAGTSSTVGTVTSVNGTGTVSGLTLTGTVTSSGSLTLGGTLSVTASNFASQTANTVLIAPNGSAGTPTFRALVAADIPALSYLSTSGGTLTGGLTVGGDLVVNGTLTSVNSNTLTVNDKNLQLASVDAVTGLQATLATSTNSVTLTAGVTNTLVAGQKLTKDSGAGSFGTGSGLTLNTTVTTGALATATVNAGGALYSVGDVINVSGGTGGQVTVTSTNGVTGVVTGVTITTPGTGYSVATGAATTVATAAGPWILSISSPTVFTTNVNHGTLGAITFSSGAPTNLTADGGGITLKGTTDKTIVWDNANTNWTSSEHWNIATGKTFKINNTTVLSSTQVLGRTPGGTTAGDLATIDATQTLTNKTFTDSTTTFQDNSDNTKKLQFELSGITTATTRTLTVPNVTSTIAVIGLAQTFTAAQTFRAASSIRAEAAATQDAVVLAGRAGGTNSYAVSLTPTTLSANRTLTLPDATGTVLSSGAEIIRLGGDVSTPEIARSRGIEALYDGRSATARRLIGVGTTTAAIVVSQFIDGWGIGDLITVSGATSGEGTKTNGTWRLTSALVGEALTVSYATNGTPLSTITGTITGGDPNHQTGDQIRILGANPSTLDGTWTITRTGPSTFTFTATSQIASISSSGTTRVPTVKFVVGSTITSGSYITAADLGSVSISKVGALSLDQGGVFNFFKHSNNNSGVIVLESDRTTRADIRAGLGIFSQVTQTPLVNGGAGTVATTTVIVKGQAATDDLIEAVGGNVLIAGGTATLTGGSNTTATGGNVSITGGYATGADLGNTFGEINIGVEHTTTINIGSGGGATVFIDGTINSGLKLASSSSSQESARISVINPTAITSASEVIIDSWSATGYRSASYIVQVSQGNPADEWYSSKIGILHYGTSTTMTEYEVLETGTIPITFTSDVSSGSVRLKATLTDGATRNATVRLYRTLIAI